ncbi:MAG: translation initiation factor IF-3 [Opitutales bacterium]
MAYPSGPRGRRRGRFERGPRKNDRIRAREVRLISPEGKQIGVVSRDEALSLAKQVGLDLVEISASARPPVCRILDFGKYMYEQSKRQKENKAKGSSANKLKEVKFRVRIEEHDYLTKMRRAEAFLYKGSKVKLSLMYRGRENEHKELGIEVLNRAAADLAHIAVLDSPPRIAGRNASTVVSPLPKHKRKLKFNTHVGEDHDDHEDDDHDDHEDEDHEGDDQHEEHDGEEPSKEAKD